MPRISAENDTTRLVARALAPQPLAVVVRVVDGAPAGTFRLGATAPNEVRPQSSTVGSDPTCDVLVRAPTVSRRHATLELVPEGVRVRDLGSRNGTFYLGQRVEQMVLALGGHLQVGEAHLVIEADTDALQDDLDYQWTEYGELVGVSGQMRRLFALMARLEGSLATVLVEGESGVGKELIARALHEASSVGDGPFVPVNCGAVSRELVGSELFGHRRGAFSGAIEDRTGAFESASGGTLFLDEIGELPLEVQPSLLRAIESGEVRRIGSDRVERVKARIIAATNRDLEREVDEGRFRRDLFYRLAVVRLWGPPLRERPEDIEPLALRFAKSAGLGELPAELMSRLRARDFPGNVRELKNAIDSFAALRVLPNAPPPSSSRAPASLAGASLDHLVDVNRPYLEARDELVERFSRLYLERVLEQAQQNQTVAAKLAGLDRTYFGRLLARYGLR
jgi:two-component system, NtrC family, response regulator GlrR